MCAIAGLLKMMYQEKILTGMLETMARRGPDEKGVYRENGCALLHSRLAIIDPEGGKQPMELTWHGKRYVLVYNGEIYNTDELRRELIAYGHEFWGHSDTEVVLHACAQWGEECLEKFNGIFAFALWEPEAKRLFLARDRIGVKPLFYTLCGDGLIFASEMKTILAYPDIPAQLDAEGAAQLLLLGPGRLPGSGVFHNIKELEPGCCAQWQDGKLSIRRYWQLKDRIHRENFGETVEIVRELVTDAIRRQMVSDVPVGTFLSGGLDSSIISAVCAREASGRGERLKTFSVDYLHNDRYFTPGKFQPNSDGEYIRIMEECIDSDHHWTVLTPEDLSQCLEDATIARDLPGMADVDFSLLAFCREIRKDVKVALSGECADEIFGGYPWYRDPQVRAREGFPWAQNTRQRIDLLHPDLTVKLDGEEFVREAYASTCRESDILPENTPEDRRVKEMVNLNFRWFMQTLLDRKDRMSMYNSLEVRVPFCDYRIAEYLYGVPWEMKDYQGMEKGLLRYALQDLLPEKVLWRKKSPYPKTHDPRYASMMEAGLKDLLEDRNAPIFSLVDRQAVINLIGPEPEWPWYGQLMRLPQLYAYLLQMDFWLRHYSVGILF